jgi:sialate O-acetylesterase
MAVTTDIGNTKDIHPRNKQEVGRRLALWALTKTYGKRGIVYSGPLYKGMKARGNKIELSFDHVGGGLSSRDGKTLTHFTIAGDDKSLSKRARRLLGSSLCCRTMVWRSRSPCGLRCINKLSRIYPTRKVCPHRRSARTDGN